MPRGNDFCHPEGAGVMAFSRWHSRAGEGIWVSFDVSSRLRSVKSYPGLGMTRGICRGGPRGSVRRWSDIGRMSWLVRPGQD